MTTHTAYTLTGTTALPFAAAVDAVRAALAAEGFGVLTEIDVQATLKAKLDVDRPPYLILGACNPPYAHRALGLEPELGALLPCNVAVYEDGGATRVSGVDPVAQLGIVGNPQLDEVAHEIRERIERALAAVWSA